MSAGFQAYHPAFLATIKVGQVPLSDDSDTAVAQTIAIMAGYVRQDRNSALCRSVAAQLRSPSSAETRQRAFRWIKSRVRFTQDAEIAAALHLPEAYSGFVDQVAEVLIRPIDLLRMVRAQGDCDDFSMLGAALLSACGLTCYFVTLAADSREPSQYSHVYLWCDGQAFDSSHGPFMGWEAENRYGKRTLWSIETGMPILRGGLSGFGQVDMCGGDPTCLAESGGGPVVPIVTMGPTYPTGGGSAIPTPVSSASPSWAADINATLSTALSILKAQYAVPPPGTVITTRAGTIATGVQPGAVVGTPSLLTGGIPGWIWIIGALAFVMLIFKGGRR